MSAVCRVDGASRRELRNPGRVRSIRRAAVADARWRGPCSKAIRRCASLQTACPGPAARQGLAASSCPRPSGFRSGGSTGMPLTRRRFLERLGATAGAGMTYQAMSAMGLLAVPAGDAAAFSLRGQVAGTRVVVIGRRPGGPVHGLRAQASWATTCRVLEARMRPGGRCHTIRRGTKSEEEGVDARSARSTTGCTTTRADADPTSPHDHARLLPRARRAGGGVRQRQRVGLPVSDQRHGARRPAPAGP